MHSLFKEKETRFWTAFAIALLASCDFSMDPGPQHYLSLENTTELPSLTLAGLELGWKRLAFHSNLAHPGEHLASDS